MRKIILMSIMLVVSSFAFSQELPDTAVSQPYSTSKSASSAETPGSANIVDSAANKVGSWLGQFAKAHVEVASALVSGVKAGYNGVTSSTSQAQKSSNVAVSESSTSATANSTSSSPVAALQDTFKNVLSMARKQLVKTQPPAPVEERTATPTAPTEL